MLKGSELFNEIMLMDFLPKRYYLKLYCIVIICTEKRPPPPPPPQKKLMKIKSFRIKWNNANGFLTHLFETNEM